MVTEFHLWQPQCGSDNRDMVKTNEFTVATITFQTNSSACAETIYQPY